MSIDSLVPKFLLGNALFEAPLRNLSTCQPANLPISIISPEFPNRSRE